MIIGSIFHYETEVALAAVVSQVTNGRLQLDAFILTQGDRSRRRRLEPYIKDRGATLAFL